MGAPAHAAVGDITTHAGRGLGDGGQAVSATLFGTYDVAVAGGSTYISESQGHRIRKVSGSGVISTVAGTGTSGYNGEGSATSKRLNAPRGLAGDGSDLLIADTGNHRVRRLSGSSIDTVAGTGSAGSGGDGGSASSAQLDSPADVAADSAGNVYIADAGNNKVRVVDGSGIISTFAGTGATGSAGDGGPASAAELNDPQSLAVDATSLYIGTANGIRRVDLATGVISTLASGIAPAGLAVGSGLLYASSPAGRKVVSLDPAAADPAATLATVAGSGAHGGEGDGGPATSAQFKHPVGVAADGSTLLIADDEAGRVRSVDAAGDIAGFAGNGTGCGFAGDGGPAVNALMGFPTAVAAHTDGSVYIADGCNGRIRKVSPSGTMSSVAGSGSFGYSEGAALAATFGGDVEGVAVGSSGVVYLSDTVNHRVRRLSTSGNLSTIAGNGIAGNDGEGVSGTAASVQSPRGLAIDPGGNIYIASGCKVRRLNGSTIATFAGTGACGAAGDGGPATAAQVNPYGLAADSAGRIYIAEAANHRIRRIDTNGTTTTGDDTITTIAGTGSAGFSGDGAAATAAKLSGPTAVAVGAGGLVYIADTGNNRIRVIRGDGKIATVAGTGTAGFGGDGSSALSAQLASPNGLALQGTNLFVSDSLNRRVRKILVPEQAVPVLAITSVTNPVAPGNRTAVSATGTTEPGASVTVTVTDGTTTTAPVTAIANGSGSWTASGIDASTLADGPITFTARVVDVDGNAGGAVAQSVVDTVNAEGVRDLTIAVGSNKVTLAWTNPTTDFHHAEIRMRSGSSAPATPDEGSAVAPNTSSSAVVNGLENCVPYSFSVFAYDPAGNPALPGASVTATPVPSSPPATSLSMNLSAGVVSYGATVIVDGALHQAGTTTPISGETVYVQARRRGTSQWSTISPALRTSADGLFSFVYRPAWSADYRVRHVGHACSGDSTSAVRSIAVRPVLGGGLSPAFVAAGSSSTVAGSVAPAQYAETVYLQRLYSGGSWRNIGTANLWGSGTSFKFTIKPAPGGRSWYRIYKPADADHAGTFTPTMTLSAVKAAIVGILYDPPGPNDETNLNGEYVTIRNTGSVGLDLAGWSIYAVGKNKRYWFGRYYLAPGATVRVFTGSGTNGPGQIYLKRTTPLWKNSADSARLYDSRGQTMSVFSYQKKKK